MAHKIQKIITLSVIFLSENLRLSSILLERERERERERESYKLLKYTISFIIKDIKNVFCKRLIRKFDFRASFFFYANSPSPISTLNINHNKYLIINLPMNEV